VTRPKVCGVKEARQKLQRLPDWSLTTDGRGIRRELRMRDFDAAVELITRVARLAGEADHHPDIHLTDYRSLRLELSTHSAGGLTEKDFLLASQIDALPKALKEAPRAGSL
jgi:4a-hydroxytetrahydrobiopterin dehydratase